MPMGIVSDSDFDKELGNVQPRKKEAEIVDIPSKGRNDGDINVPDSLRRIIGETAVTEGRREALKMGEFFGVSPSSVSAYSTGAVSTSTYDEKPNADVIVKSRDKIRKIASKITIKAMRSITDDKLEGTNAKDLSAIAKDMSAVVRNMEEKYNNSGPSNETKGPTFVFYSPQFREEKHFDIIPAKE